MESSLPVICTTDPVRCPLMESLLRSQSSVPLTQCGAHLWRVFSPSYLYHWPSEVSTYGESSPFPVICTTDPVWCPLMDSSLPVIWPLTQWGVHLWRVFAPSYLYHWPCEVSTYGEGSLPVICTTNPVWCPLMESLLSQLSVPLTLWGVHLWRVFAPSYLYHWPCEVSTTGFCSPFHPCGGLPNEVSVIKRSFSYLFSDQLCRWPSGQKTDKSAIKILSLVSPTKTRS
jgi:hypothetical protein